MIARPKISRNEWKPAERGAFGNVAPLSRAVPHLAHVAHALHGLLERHEHVLDHALDDAAVVVGVVEERQEAHAREIHVRVHGRPLVRDDAQQHAHRVLLEHGRHGNSNVADVVAPEHGHQDLRRARLAERQPPVTGPLACVEINQWNALSSKNFKPL
jgi:hypothetical protein